MKKIIVNIISGIVILLGVFIVFENSSRTNTLDLDWTIQNSVANELASGYTFEFVVLGVAFIIIGAFLVLINNYRK